MNTGMSFAKRFPAFSSTTCGGGRFARRSGDDQPFICALEKRLQLQSRRRPHRGAGRQLRSGALGPACKRGGPEQPRKHVFLPQRALRWNGLWNVPSLRLRDMPRLSRRTIIRWPGTGEMLDQYQLAKPYLSGDFYPLTQCTTNTTDWLAYYLRQAGSRRRRYHGVQASGLHRRKHHRSP